MERGGKAVYGLCQERIWKKGLANEYVISNTLSWLRYAVFVENLNKKIKI